MAQVGGAWTVVQVGRAYGLQEGEGIALVPIPYLNKLNGGLEGQS